MDRQWDTKTDRQMGGSVDGKQEGKKGVVYVDVLTAEYNFSSFLHIRYTSTNNFNLILFKYLLLKHHLWRPTMREGTTIHSVW